MPTSPAVITLQKVSRLKPAEINDLGDAAAQAIRADGGFGWIEPPSTDHMERYWRGVVLIPERILFVCRVDGVIAGSVQLVQTPRNNEAQAHAAAVTTCFVAPWARGNHLGRRLLHAAEQEAQQMGVKILNLDVRETQTHAIRLIESYGFLRWGSHPFYVWVRGQIVAGHYYYKEVTGTAHGDTVSP